MSTHVDTDLFRWCVPSRTGVKHMAKHVQQVHTPCRGRGWWTVRLYEAFYAGCIPVLLSDEIDLPFDFLNWETFSVKWPMRDLEKLYEHLLALSKDAKLDALHRQVRQVACWFDYLQPRLRLQSFHLEHLEHLVSSTVGVVLVWNADSDEE